MNNQELQIIIISLVNPVYKQERSGLHQSTELWLIYSIKALPGHWIHSNIFSNQKSWLCPFLFFSVHHLTFIKHSLNVMKVCILWGPGYNRLFLLQTVCFLLNSSRVKRESERERQSMYDFFFPTEIKPSSDIFFAVDLS